MGQKTIAVQTFWRSQLNYGQLLQGYALQTFLRKHNYNSFIIRFDSFISRLKELLVLAINGKFLTVHRQKQLRKFDDFRKANIIYSNRLYCSFGELKRNAPKADVYIVGSDQVWTYMRNSDRRNGYLLQFGQTSTKKIAYAASFGRDHLKDDENDFKNGLAAFSFLGIREESGVDICKSLGYDAQWVTDPVTLLSASDWRSLKAHIVLRNGVNNLFIYTLTNVNQNSNYKKLYESLKSKYEVFYTNSSELIDDNCTLFPSPYEWLAYIDDSNFVVTDSFHCSMFCIIFNKPFVAVERGNGAGMSNRLTSMLARLGLSKRYVKCDAAAVLEIMDEGIDWYKVNYELNNWVSFSKDKLLSAIEE